MKLYIVPGDIHDRVSPLGIPTYSKMLETAAVRDILPFNDIVALCVAQRSFEFEFEEYLNITLGDSPLDRAIKLDEKEGLPEPSNFVSKLKWAIRQKEQEEVGVTNISSYTLCPIDRDVWVVVKRRVHCTASHPKEEAIRVNESFFDKLIASVYYDVDLTDLAKSQLVTNYLLAVKLNNGTTTE